jgi:two-component sensor histidine kinase
MSVWRGVLESGRALVGYEVRGSTPAQPDVERIWSEHFFPLQSNGETFGLAAIAEDITDKRRDERRLRDSEAQLRALFSAIDEGYCVCELVFDANGEPVDYRVLDANRVFEDMTGVRNPHGRTALELWPDMDRSRIARNAGIALGEASQRFEVTAPETGRTYDVFGAPLEPRGRFALILQDVTERREAEAYRQLLIDELNHRVKNILATVQAMASHTLRDAADLNGFQRAFTGRLLAISAAHDIIFASRSGSASLRDLIVKQVGPYAGQDADRMTLVGPEAHLSANVAHGLSLIVHELATNAAKYGALSRESGRIEVSWSVDRGGETPLVRLVWRERGGPRVTPPQRTGFGSRLIRSALSHAAGGSADVAYEADGVVAQIAAPVEVHGGGLVSTGL